MRIVATGPGRLLAQCTIASILSALLLGCSTRVLDSHVGRPLPLPEGALEVEVVDLGEGSQEVSFYLECEHRSSKVLEFYGDWAADRGWKKVPEKEEPWSMDRWESFGPPWDQTDQYFVHWRSSDRTWSLRIAVRHRTGSSHQFAIIQLVPYQLLS